MNYWKPLKAVATCNYFTHIWSIFQQIRTLNEPWTNLLVFYRKFACNDLSLLSHYSNSIFFKFDDERWASHICLWKMLTLINRPKSLSLVLCCNFNNSLSPIDRNLSNNENLESVIIPLFERNQPMVNESDKKNSFQTWH